MTQLCASDVRRPGMRQGARYQATSCHFRSGVAIRERAPVLRPGTERGSLTPPLLHLIAMLLVSCVGAMQSESLAAETYVANPENYLGLLKRLTPGDHLSLRPGIYTSGLPLRRITGSKDAPIVIGGPLEGQPAVFRARPDANTINIADSSYVIVRDLLLDGGNLPVDGIVTDSRSRPVHHITLERLTIIGHGYDQSIVAIGTRCPTAFWTIRDNTIVGAGTGMYLGGSDGSAPFVAGLIEGNRIVDTIGYNIQIKHQKQRPDLAELPDSPQSTVIRGNFFSKSSNASQGGRARPNLLIGHPPVVGTGSHDVYEVVNNVFYYNPFEVLLQAEGNLLISDNLFVNPVGSAIAVRPHHDVPRQIDIKRNFIAAASVGVSVSGGHPGYRQLVESNSVYAKNPLMGGSHRQNVTGPYAELGRELRQWLARQGTTGFNGQLDGVRTLTQMANRVCIVHSGAAINRDGPSGHDSTIDRSCQFLRALVRDATAQPDD